MMDYIVGILVVSAFLSWLINDKLRSRTKKYIDNIALSIENEDDRELFRRLYRAKEPRSIEVACLLSTFLTPTISYVYQKKWGLAIISFATFQGLAIWWFISLFSMPFEVCARNRILADQAHNDLLLARGRIAC